jgi:hypothetical protein
MIIIIMRGANFVAHLDVLGGTPVAHHRPRQIETSVRVVGNTTAIQTE